MSLTRKEIDTMFTDARKDITVSCDEYHAHMAMNGCLRPVKSEVSGKHAVNVCKLCEYIIKFQDEMEKLHKKLALPTPDSSDGERK